MIYFKNLEVQQQVKTKHSCWQEIIMIRVAISEIETIHSQCH